MASEIETNMVGVERIKEYQEIKEEAPLLMPEQDPPENWPEFGVVKFENYQTRYGKFNYLWAKPYKNAQLSIVKLFSISIENYCGLWFQVSWWTRTRPQRNRLPHPVRRESRNRWKNRSRFVTSQLEICWFLDSFPGVLQKLNISVAHR